MIDFYTTNSLKWNNIEEVQVKKLDTLIKEFGLPNFCKIDTEGYELDILTNLSYTIPIIEFEFNEAFIEDTLKITFIPKSNSAHGACSRLDPQPKLFPAKRILEFLYASLLRIKESISFSSKSYLIS